MLHPEASCKPPNQCLTLLAPLFCTASPSTISPCCRRPLHPQVATALCNNWAAAFEAMRSELVASQLALLTRLRWRVHLTLETGQPGFSMSPHRHVTPVLCCTLDKLSVLLAQMAVGHALATPCVVQS